MKKTLLPLLALLAATPATAASDGVLGHYDARARAADPAFAGFSAWRGEALFRQPFAGGKPETPACTACHSNSPQGQGRTRAGKPIAPMALSLTPDRYADLKKAEKWFRRNCRSVLGRECTPVEKGDFVTFMSGL